MTAYPDLPYDSFFFGHAELRVGCIDRKKSTWDGQNPYKAVRNRENTRLQRGSLTPVRQHYAQTPKLSPESRKPGRACQLPEVRLIHDAGAKGRHRGSLAFKHAAISLKPELPSQ